MNWTLGKDIYWFVAESVCWINECTPERLPELPAGLSDCSFIYLSIELLDDRSISQSLHKETKKSADCQMGKSSNIHGISILWHGFPRIYPDFLKTELESLTFQTSIFFLSGFSTGSTRYTVLKFFQIFFSPVRNYGGFFVNLWKQHGDFNPPTRWNKD